jgi:sulfur carrier protein ThiS
LPVARLVGSAAAATAARGADLLVIERAVAVDLAIVRRVAAAGWEPALVWCAPEPDAARARFAAGCEGIVVAWEDVDPRSPADALKRLAAALPPKPSGSGALVPIVFDGASLAVEPDTTIADLLADAGLPDNVVVRVNGVRLARHRYDETATRPGDAIEVDRTSAGRGQDSD